MSASNMPVLEKTSTSIDVSEAYRQANQLYQLADTGNSKAYLQQAYEIAFKAHKYHCEYLPLINLLSRIELKREKSEDAWLWVKLGLRIQPQSPSLLYSAGHLALSEQRLTDAENYFKQSLNISKTATRSASSLANVYLLKQDFVSAFQAYRELARTQSQDTTIKNKLFEACSGIQADFYSKELEQDLLDYLDYEQVDYSLLAPLITSLLKHKFRLSEKGCPLELETLVQDPLLLKSLTRFYFCDPLIERLLMTLRQSILHSSASNLAIERLFLPFVIALSHQTELNEGIYYISEKEQEIINQLTIILSKMLMQTNITGEDIYPVLLLVLMYQPIRTSNCYEQIAKSNLAWPNSMSELMKLGLLEAQTLSDLESNIIALGELNDEVSKKVQQQYLTHPYPRWQSLGESNKNDYLKALELHFPNENFSSLKHSKPLSVLVAGCGTGRHALNLANNFKQLDITAIDLSSRSLAYGQQKAKEMGIDNISFYQADILDQSVLLEPYDLIESSGVLHHMDSPIDGLKALEARLKPGGIIKLGLYSGAARQQVSALRNYLAEDMPTEDSEIRLVREAILQDAIKGDFSEIITSADFYSLSGCRDLLFHAQEHVFDIVQLDTLLKEANLYWLGFLAPASAYRQAQKVFNKQPNQLSIEQWQELEKQNPSLFAGMYQFYARKPN